MGFLPDAMKNYLLRLGWAHGDDEIISQDQAIRWFDVRDIGRSAARFDMDKLTSLNGHYIRHANVDHLVALILPIIGKNFNGKLADQGLDRLKNGMTSLRDRAKNILELAEIAKFYAISRPIPYDAKAIKLLDVSAVALLAVLRGVLSNLPAWGQSELETAVHDHAVAADAKLGKIAQPLRAAMTGTTVSPGIFEVLEILGKDEVLGRLDDAIAAHAR